MLIIEHSVIKSLNIFSRFDELGLQNFNDHQPVFYKHGFTKYYLYINDHCQCFDYAEFSKERFGEFTVEATQMRLPIEI